MREFYIIHAKDPDTNGIEKFRIYSSKEQYERMGRKQVKKFLKSYKVVVTKYICNEEIQIINQDKNESSRE